MIDKIAEHFHQNYYPDLPYETVRTALDDPEKFDMGMAHIAQNGHDDPEIVIAANANESIKKFNKKYGTKYTDLYDFTGVKDPETKAFFENIQDEKLKKALYTQHLQHGKPNIRQGDDEMPVFKSLTNNAAASYNPIENTIYLKGAKGRAAPSRYVQELAHAEQAKDMPEMVARFMTNDMVKPIAQVRAIPAFILQSAYEHFVLGDSFRDQYDRNESFADRFNPYKDSTSVEGQAHQIIAKKIIEAIEKDTSSKPAGP